MTLCHPIAEPSEHEGERTLRTRVYWAARRSWNNEWLRHPSKICYELKYAYQRVVRGWDDRAVWNIARWLDEKMPDMLRKLKEDKHGVPTSMFDGLPVNAEKGYHDDPEFKIARGRWDATVDKMIGAFEASRRIQGLAYDEELGPHPLRRPEGVSREAWQGIQDERVRKSEELRKRDEKVFEEGMALFIKHYWSLWD